MRVLASMFHIWASYRQIKKQLVGNSDNYREILGSSFQFQLFGNPEQLKNKKSPASARDFLLSEHKNMKEEMMPQWRIYCIRLKHYITSLNFAQMVFYEVILWQE